MIDNRTAISMNTKKTITTLKLIVMFFINTLTLMFASYRVETSISGRNIGLPLRKTPLANDFLNKTIKTYEPVEYQDNDASDGDSPRRPYDVLMPLVFLVPVLVSLIG